MLSKDLCGLTSLWTPADNLIHDTFQNLLFGKMRTFSLERALIDGRYTKERYLGKGGFAYCVQVTDQTDDKKYAMKVIPKVANGKQRCMEKIENEISILVDMDHPSVARMHRFFEDEENVYIVLELCDNKSMIDLLKVRQRLTEDEVR